MFFSPYTLFNLHLNISNKDNNSIQNTCILYWLSCLSSHNLKITKGIIAPVDLLLTIVQIKYELFLVFLLLQLGI